MFTEILEEFVEEIKGKESDWFDQLREGFSLEEVEREILDMVNDLSSRLTGSLLERVLADRELLKQVRLFGGKLAYRLASYQEVALRLANGKSIKVRSPYFGVCPTYETSPSDIFTAEPQRTQRDERKGNRGHRA